MKQTGLWGYPLVFFLGYLSSTLITVLNHLDTHVNSQTYQLPLPSMVIGIMCTKEDKTQREWIRKTWMQKHDEFRDIEVYFVIAQTMDNFLAIEKEINGDIIMLNIEENMNKGKTYAWLSYCAANFHGMDYVIKRDMDTFIDLEKLQTLLLDYPKESLYLGVKGRGETDDNSWSYVGGQLVVLSQDLVQWIATDEIPKKYQFGDEDRVTGAWFYLASKPVLQVNLYHNDPCKPWTHPVKSEQEFYNLHLNKLDACQGGKVKTSQFASISDSGSNT